MKKHAYIIMAHDNLYCLEKLILLLDDPRNDIFLHIDAKVGEFDFPYFQSLCKHSVLIYPPKRINVCWGTQSQVKTEMLMLKTASSYGYHHYYHILSGSDLPLRSQDDIHAWFSGRTTSFLYYTERPSQWDVQRISRYHNVFGHRGVVSSRLNGIFSRIQESLAVDRLKGLDIEVKKGSNWASLTQKAVDVLLSYEARIMKLTRFSVCADEVYKQTILVHENCPIIRDDLREIHWVNGNHPQTYSSSDYEMLCRSEKMFARKFSEKMDREIIDLIYDKVRCETECASK